jgi:hypothetical protein
MDQWVSKEEARKMLKSLALSIDPETSMEHVVYFHAILRQLESAGFHLNPFFIPTQYLHPPIDANRLRVHILACIHHLKKADPKGA